MSGRKYSQVELQKNVREAIRCRIAAEESCSQAESLVQTLSEASETTESLKPAAQSAQSTLEEIRQELESIKKEISDAKINDLSLSTVQNRQKKIRQLESQLDRIIQICRKGDVAAAQRSELMAILGQLERNREHHELWLKDIYDKFISKTHSLIEEADDEIRTTGSLQSTATKITDHATQYSQMLNKVTKRRNSDEERRYIASALEEVCKEMGFSTEYLPQENPLEDLVLRVNTHAFGLIDFRLQLDGIIRSESEMIEPSCGLNFAKIEDRLKTLGVISGFRFEGDQRPVRLQKGAKSLSGSDPDSGKSIEKGAK